MRLFIEFVTSFYKSLSGPIGNAISACVGIASGIFYSKYLRDNRTDIPGNVEFIGSIILGFITYMFLETIIRAISMKNYEEQIVRIEKLFKDFSFQSRVHGTILKSMIVLSEKKEILHNLAMKRIKSHMKDVSISENSEHVDFHSQGSVLGSFSDYWDEITRIQIERGKHKPMYALLTHAGPIGLYSNVTSSLTVDLLRKQDRFMIEGGIIFRILIQGEDNDVKDLDDYRKTLLMMSKRNVNVACINYDELFKSRFLGINYDLSILLPSKHTVEWFRNRDGSLKGCRFSQEIADYNRFVDIWHELIDVLKSIDYCKAEAIETGHDIFASSRDDFITKYQKIAKSTF